MGHYASEMSSTWNESIERTDRKMALRRAVADLPLSRFKTKDLPILQRLFSYDDLFPEDEERLQSLSD